MASRNARASKSAKAKRDEIAAADDTGPQGGSTPPAGDTEPSPAGADGSGEATPDDGADSPVFTMGGSLEDGGDNPVDTSGDSMLPGADARASRDTDDGIISGIDVSVWQGVIDWQAVAASGAACAVVRANYGTAVDKKFADNWAGMKQAGLIRGAYHYFRPAQDAGAQADKFIATVGALDEGDLPPVIDVEETGGLSGGDVLDRVGIWIDKVWTALSRKPMIYTGPAFWKGSLGDSGRFTTHPLWIAHYTQAVQPLIPGGWPLWTFWQYTGKGRINGIQGNVDLDRFNGTLVDLNALAGVSMAVASNDSPAERDHIPVAAGAAGAVAPAIMGPESCDRNQSAPAFTVTLGANRFYAVEVANQAGLFDVARAGKQRTPQNFYGSWQEGLREGSGQTVYALPAMAWAQLNQAPRLFYRVVTTSSRDSWVNYQTSTPDEQAGQAPSIALSGRAGLHSVEQPHHSEEELWDPALAGG